MPLIVLILPLIVKLISPRNKFNDIEEKHQKISFNFEIKKPKVHILGTQRKSQEFQEEKEQLELKLKDLEEEIEKKTGKKTLWNS